MPRKQEAIEHFERDPFLFQRVNRLRHRLGVGLNQMGCRLSMGFGHHVLGKCSMGVLNAQGLLQTGLCRRNKT